jgi:hypothetical protein
MLMRVIVTIFMFMRMRMDRLTSPELFPGQVFLSAGNHIHLSSADSAAVNPPDLQTRIDAQRADRPRKDLRGNSGIY